jgi:23S rRNA (uracil1939-C5)-methyltransferase
LSYGPHGVGRLADGKAVFVRGVAPGEEVDIHVREDRKSLAYAELERIVQPSPERRQPPCEYLPDCGGCPWQHLTYEGQLRAKEQSVRDALTRIGKLDAVTVRPILRSPREFGYRSRLNMRVAGGEVGFYRGATHNLVAISHCLLAETEVDQAVPHTRDLIRRLGSNVRRIEIVSRGDGSGVVLHAEVEGALAPRDPQQVATFLTEVPEVSGVVLHGRRWRQSWGDVMTQVTPADGIVVALPAGAFSQVNPTANRLLVETVLDLADLGPQDRVLELHAGAGNLTLPLAGRARRVVAVEQYDAAAAAAIDNSRGLENVEVRVASAADAVGQCLARGEQYDVVVLDPPRSGAAEVVNGLLQMAPRRLIYVSCNPATLARDLARLAPRYQLETVQPIDMFPHTYHVESVVRSVLT